MTSVAAMVLFAADPRATSAFHTAVGLPLEPERRGEPAEVP